MAYESGFTFVYEVSKYKDESETEEVSMNFLVEVRYSISTYDGVDLEPVFRIYADENMAMDVSDLVMFLDKETYLELTNEINERLIAEASELLHEIKSGGFSWENI